MTSAEVRPGPRPKKLTKDEARAALPEHLRATFDSLCEDTVAWSLWYYQAKFISYSILKELVESGWKKVETED